MKNLFALILIFLSLVSFVSCACEEGQIDINDASKEELDKLYGIGPAKAEAIISERPFECVDDLIKVNGIGEITLQNIKTQGLVCVKDGEEEEKSEAEIEDLEQTSEAISETKEKVDAVNKVKSEPEDNTIKLSTKNIKSEENIESLDKVDYLKYGFVVFCSLLGILLLIKKGKYKTEFN